MGHDGRFAPSPTGDLHLGNLRTALLAWLFARSARARFLLRVEDLDTGRVRPGAEERQLRDLRRLGLEWDGPVTRQSERGSVHREALATLAAAGLVYSCWCTRAEIAAAASAPHGSEGVVEGAYPGTCRDLPALARRNLERSAKPAALRVRTEGARVRFDDRLAGPQEGRLDDFVVRRNDGAYAYNLAVAVDDADQGIDEVVRGADLLATTARQIWVLERLGLDVPAYAHVPLMLGDDGRRMAKRNGARCLDERLVDGGTAEHVISELAASVGLIAASSGPLPAQALLCEFDPARIAPGT